MGNIGMLAELTKKQTNRLYFSDIPIGTKFIIVDEFENDHYELTGYFLNIPPQRLYGDKYHYTGYIEVGSWRLIGKLEDNIQSLNIYGIS